jgi:hypothetical protein
VGNLTATLPNGYVHRWVGRDAAQIARFLDQFREKLLRHIRNDTAAAAALAHRSDDEAIADYAYGMMRHMLGAEVFAEPTLIVWRGAFLTWFLLTQRSQDPERPGQFRDYLLENDIEFRLALLPEGIDTMSRIVPCGARPASGLEAAWAAFWHEAQAMTDDRIGVRQAFKNGAAWTVGRILQRGQKAALKGLHERGRPSARAVQALWPCIVQNLEAHTDWGDVHRDAVMAGAFSAITLACVGTPIDLEAFDPGG